MNDVHLRGGARSPGLILLSTAGLLAAGIAAAFAFDGWNEEAVRRVVRATAKLAILLFAAAFSASALQSLHPSTASRWMLRNRRYLGLAFALSHGVHLLSLIVLAVAFPDPFVNELNAFTLIGGGIAYGFVFAMALTSSDAAVARLGGRRWKRLHTVGAWYIWIVFLQSYGPRAFEEPAYIPWALVVLIPLALRILRWARLRPARAGA